MCKELTNRFSGADLAVQGRSVQSPVEVSVDAQVDGKPLSLRYVLFGYQWRLDKNGRLAELLSRPSPLSAGPSTSGSARKPQVERALDVAG